ncbi:MAG TPA: hypothetical protein VIF62_21625 [Labilithrix sp.]|jgi:hypothetical protein
MSNQTRTIHVSPKAVSVAPPPPSGTRRALAAGKYVLTACHDGTGRAQRGVATVFVTGVTTYVRFRRIAMTDASRAVHAGVYELDRESGDIRRGGVSIGRFQTTDGVEPELILVLIGTTEIWALA